MTKASLIWLQIAETIRSLIAFDSIVCVDSALLLRAIQVYELDRVKSRYM